MDEANTRENRHMYERFTTDVMGGRCVTIPANGSVDDIDEGLKSDILAGKVKAAIVSGSLLDEEMFKKIEYLVIADCLPSDAIALADAVLPVTILAELEGTFRNSSGEVLSLGRTVPIRGEARPEWQILGDLAAALGHQELSFKTVDEITAKIADDPAPAKFAGAPRDTLADLPGRFRGHYIADYVPALEAMDLPSSPKPPVAPLIEGFRVLSKKEVVPNFFSLTIEAPAVATYAKPGQFIIVMVNEFSERVPFTLIDWDAEAGTITLIVEEVGRSSGEIAQVEEGGLLAHVTGPLGMPLTVAEGETVVLGGGCYGVGAIYPIAKALKQSGKHVICVIEASSSFLLYMEKEMREVCNELIIATKDGSRGLKGGVQEVFVNIVNRGTKVDQFIAIGCTFMMRMVTEATRPLGVPLQVALNPIMVDGTGMCGACRLAVGEETKFACVDGPFFDGHLVDWDELASRRSAYAREEIEAIPPTAGGGRMVTEPAPAGPGACAGTCGGGSHGRRSTVQHLTVSK